MLHAYVRLPPVQRKGDAPGGAHRPKHERDALIDAYPWAQEILADQAHRSGDASSSGGCAAVVPEALPDDIITKAWEDLAEKRREWELAGGSAHDDFFTRVLGGAWTATHKKKAFDAVAGMARNSVAKTWCRRYGLNIEASFSLAKYGESDAPMLALQWCDRMQHYFLIYKANGAGDYHYTDEDMESFEESLDWVNFVLDSGPESPIWDRAMAIRNLRPLKDPT